MELLKAVADRFLFSSQMLNWIAGDFSKENWLTKAGSVNCGYWVLGHLTLMRTKLLGLIGVENPAPAWERIFAMKSSGEIPPEAPSPQELLTLFHRTSETIATRLREMPTSAADEPCQMKLPDGSSLLGQALLGLFMHETYHIGQIGLIRRLLGKPGLAQSGGYLEKRLAG